MDMDGSTMTDGMAPSPDASMSGMAGGYSNDESGGKKQRRQQGKQACQQCRRRKIKCDESRPECLPCAKGKLSCTYELPAGQTRQQALMESQSKIQHELEAHASLIQNLRTLPSDASIRVLNALREGVYDGVLLGAISSPGAESIQSESQHGYPWEFDGEQDAVGEDDDDYDYVENATSPAQSYSQYGAVDMQLGQSGQSAQQQHQQQQQQHQQRSGPYPMAPQAGSGLPYPGYYAPYGPYSAEIGQSQPVMGAPDGVGLGAEQHQYQPQQSQQSQIQMPSQYPLRMAEDPRMSSKKR